jgi:hypothetical protein
MKAIVTFDRHYIDPVDGGLIAAFRATGKDRAALEVIVDKAIKMQQRANTGVKLRMEIDKYRERRSLDANAYFHRLVGLLADAERAALGADARSADAIKRDLVLTYGTPAMEDGEYLFVALPKNVTVENYYPYAKWINDFTAKNGKVFSQYQFYKQTHTLDSLEMKRLIDGARQECFDNGIDPRTFDEINNDKSFDDAYKKMTGGKKDEQALSEN